MRNITAERYGMFYQRTEVSTLTHTLGATRVFLGNMELTQLIALKDDPRELISKITSVTYTDYETSKQYEPENHAINDKPKREVWLPVKDSNGQTQKIKDEHGNETNEDQLKRDFEEVCKTPSVAQKQIVDWAVQIAAGVPVELTAYNSELSADEQTMVDMLKRTLRDNKMSYLDQHILRLTSIHKICAEIWYREEAPGFWDSTAKNCQGFKMRLVVLSAESGDDLYPVKDNMGKMIALGRKYIVLDEAGESVNKFDLFTSESIQTYTEEKSGWSMDAPIPLSYGKANFIVHQQYKTEWEDVQAKIDRLEYLDGSVGDANELSGSPILAVTGGVKDFGKRGESGKVFEMNDGGDMKYVEAKGAHEAIKFERENLLKDIFDGTNTPQISFDDASGFGANIPGITLKLLFLPATLKAMGKQAGGWGMSIQRRYNFLMYAMATICPRLTAVREMEVAPRFQIFMPENTTEKYENVVKLYQAGLLSQEKAVEMIGIAADDLTAEIARLEEEAKSKVTPTLSVA